MPSLHSAAAALGKKGGTIGGRSRSAAKVAAARRNIARANASISDDARRIRAQKAAQARWRKANATRP